MDLDVLSERRPFERVAAIAIALTLAMLWVRLLWLWLMGTIRSEPFLGSAGWTTAIVAPGAIWMGHWGISSLRCRRALAVLLHARTSREPLMAWRRRIATVDWLLEIGLPVDVSALVIEIARGYPELDDEMRAGLRAVWRAYPSFAEAAYVREELTSVEAVRRALILHSIRDQRPDARDEVVALDAVAAAARRAGIDVAALAREAAMLSDASGCDQTFGSTREQLLQYARR